MSDINPREARDLGMSRTISRRDFFDGVAMTAGVATLGSLTGCSGAGSPGGAGPVQPGVRGDTAAALSVPHALRDDRFWQHAGTPEPTGETYDLVVVGGGVSGVSAAHEWLRRDPAARVLILDNHDELGEEPRIGAVSVWTPEGRELLDRLGIAVREPDGRHYPGLGMYDSVLCDRETYPVERLICFTPEIEAEQWVGRLPLADRARRDLLALYQDPADWFPGLSRERKQERLANLTYSAFLLDVCGAHPDVERFCRTMPSADWAYDARAFGAIDAWGRADGWEFPGFRGLRLDRDKPSRFNSPTVQKEWGEPRVHCLPQRGRTLVRTMLARMIPGFTGSRDHEPADRRLLDLPANPVRFRLSSPVVSVRHDGPPDTASSVTVGYFDGHAVRTVGAGSVIMACWHTVIPHLVPELPDDQRRALREAVKQPLLQATVRLRDGEAWRRVGVHRTRWTGAYWCLSELDPRADPAGPVTARLVATPCRSELGPAEGAVAGRHALLRTPYDHLEYTVRDQLARLLGPGGFDPATDIEAITIDRWGHAQAPEYCRPWHAFYPDGPFPADLARRPFGRIAIAGSDAIPAARTDAAITAACRAVTELTA